MELIPNQRIHLIGIGGYGMSAIARILLRRGFAISGSDKQANSLTEALARDGATIHIGHAPDNVHGVDVVIRTSAVKDDHIEVQEAKRLNIPIYKRQDIFHPLLRDHVVVAIAGTHGKTTTTAMLVHVLRECGVDPSYIVGGIMTNTGNNADVGKDNIFVIEADEYDHAFWGIPANMIILTNIEYDHPDFFVDRAVMVDAFRQFLDKMRPPATLIVCADSPLARQLADEHKAKGKPIYTYGIEKPADVCVKSIQIAGDKMHFEVDSTNLGDVLMGRVTLNLTGRHNVQNALGVWLAVSLLRTVPTEKIVDAFASFKSTGRRFDIRGERDGIIVVDDYAHHPTAIKMTIEGAKLRYPEHVIWAVWQPHMYTRTMVLIDDYAHAFHQADRVIVTDIYAARENPIDGITGAWAADQIQHSHTHYSGDLQATARYLFDRVRAPAVILIMSAGDAPQIGDLFLKFKDKR